MALAAILISAAAVVTSIIVAIRQHALGKEAVKIDGRMLAIEETRFQWDKEARQVAAEADAAEDANARSAVFGVRFGFRDSARTWGRLIARNNGPANAREVSLEIGALVAGQPVAVEPVSGTEYSKAALLQPSESVHVGVGFAFGSPAPEDLTYRLRWIDGRGPQLLEGRVPLD